MKPNSQRLSGWGNYPVEHCRVSRPEKATELAQIVACGADRDYISRGLGRAYGDSALNRDGGVIDGTRLDHLLSFDEQTGVLQCEAGVSLAEVIDVFLPRGWFPPTVPGTKYVTVGGALAADIHGKNHHLVGSIGRAVVDMKLLTAAGVEIECSPTCEPEIFWATIGGMGLTGVILSARLRLVRVPSAYCDVTYRRADNLDQALDVFAATERDYTYSVAWIDCVARGRSLGRSVIMLGRNALGEQLPAAAGQRPWCLPSRRRWSVPLDMPGVLLGPWSVRAFNSFYYARQRDRRAIVDFDSFFFPLDSVLHWNRIYGRRGFVQYQCFFRRKHRGAR